VCGWKKWNKSRQRELKFCLFFHKQMKIQMYL
jgi:hypothetical protein